MSVILILWRFTGFKSIRTSESPGDHLNMHIPGPCPRPSEPEPLGMRTGDDPGLSSVWALHHCLASSVG